MLELAEIFRRHGAAYRDKYGGRMLPSHRRAMRDIESCRTERLGGQVYICRDCQEIRYSYHSCKNRHCPKCQGEAAERWLGRQVDLRLPVPYFLLTFTLPAGLREAARRHQRAVYGLLFRASAAAMQELARDRRLVGGEIGMVGVLQTWSRNLAYHPHVHYLVAGGGLTEDERAWRSAREGFFLPVKALSRLFRGKFRAGLKGAAWFGEIPGATWHQEWVVHCEPVGDGRAALKYLAPYIFRVALSNHRLRRLEGGRVTFSYRDGESGEERECTLEVETFIHRFLQHVLPKGFVKVRYYGLFSASKRARLALARAILGVVKPTRRNEPRGGSEPWIRCPKCGKEMRCVQRLEPRGPPVSLEGIRWAA